MEVLGGLDADSGEEPLADTGDVEEAGDDSDDGSSSVELNGMGCDASSKSQCPVAKKMGQPSTRIPWGKTSTRKKKKKQGKTIKKKMKCGEWRRLCLNIARTWSMSGKCKRLGARNKHIMDVIKSDIRTDPASKQRFKGDRDESVHIRPGGRSRVLNFKEAVTQGTSLIVDFVGPNKKLFTLTLGHLRSIFLEVGFSPLFLRGEKIWFWR